MLALHRIEPSGAIYPRGRGLGLHYIQPVPPAREPEVVARMAAELGVNAGDVDTWGGVAFKLALLAGVGAILAFSYYGCVRRGDCKGFR